MGKGTETGEHHLCLGNWGHTNLVRMDELCRFTKAGGFDTECCPCLGFWKLGPYPEESSH